LDESSPPEVAPQELGRGVAEIEARNGQAINFAHDQGVGVSVAERNGLRHGPDRQYLAGAGSEGESSGRERPQDIYHHHYTFGVVAVCQ
jgi:hypothetical protein